MLKGIRMLVSGAALLVAATVVQAAGVQIQGAGATFPAPLYAKWIAAYNTANPAVKVDYQAIGSGGGIKGITDRTVQFAGSDAPMNADQEKNAPGKILHIPTVAGPAVIIYNLSAVKGLKLNNDVVAGIFLGEITKWNDAKLRALNAGVDLPDADIIVAHRSDGSGTSYIFTDFLAKASAKWKSSVGPAATAVKWPVGLGGKGNDGVAAAVDNAEGAIGYVEFAYAKKKNLAYAIQINKAGNTVEPSIDNVNAAAAAIKDFPADMKVSITDTNGTSAYPICGYTYILIYQDLSYLPQEQAAAVVQYLNWCIHEGQDTAKDLGYARLAPDLQKKVEDELKTITFDGAPLLK